MRRLAGPGQGHRAPQASSAPDCRGDQVPLSGGVHTDQVGCSDTCYRACCLAGLHATHKVGNMALARCMWRDQLHGSLWLESCSQVQHADQLCCRRVNPELSSVMGDNMAKLHQREERLRSINNKAEDMSETAGSFASLAKQLRDREANKKWYQI